ncbi:MAG: hypothetical protein M1812_004155 [Candelaria pacifica]|nr:MAG: hypothetical protein M1812_004155 [Candelaria pacifica]
MSAPNGSSLSCADINKFLKVLASSTPDTESSSNGWPQLAPNQDINGIAAYSTFFIVIVYHFMGYIPEQFLNAIDRGILDVLWCKARFKPAKAWEPTLRRAVLVFSDQQVVTGIALLTSGYAQLPVNIASYHWELIVYLSWFSSLTHLATLTVLRQYFLDHSAARIWRAILMLVTATLLAVALLPTGDYWWLKPITKGLPASCFFERLGSRNPAERLKWDRDQTPPMVISLLVLCSGYLTRLIRFSPQTTAFSKRWFITKPGQTLRGMLNDSAQRVSRPNASVYWRLKRMVYAMGKQRKSLRNSNLQSAANEEDHHRSRTRQPTVMYVGQWTCRATSASGDELIASSTLPRARRTGMDLQNEEENVESVSTRVASSTETQAAEVTLQDTTPLGDNLRATREQTLNYYQLEWFWLLIFMMFFLLSNITMFVIVSWAASSGQYSTMYAIEVSLKGAAIGTFFLIVYACIFVLLEEFHEPLEKAVETYARLSRQLQRRLLRVCAYAYPFCVTALLFGMARVHWAGVLPAHHSRVNKYNGTS